MAGEPRIVRREETPPVIPGYEISQLIGRGASGVVYRARQQAVDREVAIKILHAHLAGEARVVRRLQREARTTARLAHPHIVSAVDMGETDGRSWYAMEFVDGPSLGQRLRSEGRLREREALRLFIPLCEAIEHLWEHGVVHRDIKPGNILLDRTGGARLADLGLAFAEDDPSITGTGGTLGTPHYISPEQAVDPRNVDVRSDLWSFGASLFHAVCGRPPFSGESAAEVLSGVLYARIPDPQECEPSLSKRLSLVLRKCLTRDPARRYQDPHELLLDLERVRERRAPRVRRAALDPVERHTNPARRWAIAAGVTLVPLLLLALYLQHRWRGADAAQGPPLSGSGAFAGLEDLAARHASGRAKPAELLAELLEMAPNVPDSQHARHEELVRGIDSELRQKLRGLRDELEGEIDRAIVAGDLKAGWSVLTDRLEPRLSELTGCGFEGLAAVGVNLGAWRDRLALKLTGATDTAVSELEALLHDWRNTRLSEVEAAVTDQDWERALAALRLPDRESIFAEAGFHLRLPDESQAGLLDEFAREFRQRSERLQADWRRLDRELESFVERRRATLERTLRESAPRIAAADMLRADFERMLFDRDLSREKMPQGLSRAGLEALDSSAERLLTLERQLLESDAREAYAEADGRTAPLLRQRSYDQARAIWEAARAKLESTPRFAELPPAQEHLQRIDLRIAEARSLSALLQRVAVRVLALDGRSIELRWGSITYSNVKLLAGSDPLRQGFRAEGIPGIVRIERLPSQQLEVLAEYRPEADLAPDERLQLALFRFHEGRLAEGQRALFSGALPSAEPARTLGADLAGRLSSAMEQEEQRGLARESEAQHLYDSVLDPELMKNSPNAVDARIARLLDEFGDLALVRQKRSELLRLRSGLESNSTGKDLEFQRVFQPLRYEVSPVGRVTLHYDFGEGALGAWKSGDWVFDGVGFTLGREAPVTGWDELPAQRGLRLMLEAPLVPDSFDLLVRFEALQGDTPARVLWLTAAGFQVALTAPELPGAQAGPRFLVGTEEGGPFLQRLLSGKGKRMEALLVPGGPPRELRIKGQRRSGRCEVLLDGTSLETTTGLPAPPSEARALVLRSWGSVRVLKCSIEGGR